LGPRYVLLCAANIATYFRAAADVAMALMRRAVEHLAAEKADIVIPDYSTTLGEMAKRLSAIAQGLVAIADKPAVQLTPEGLAGADRGGGGEIPRQR